MAPVVGEVVAFDVPLDAWRDFPSHVPARLRPGRCEGLIMDVKRTDAIVSVYGGVFLFPLAWIVEGRMSEHEPFIRAIIRNPADDAPRLIYADWLDEHGDPIRAEFIRVQIALSYEQQEKDACPVGKNSVDGSEIRQLCRKYDGLRRREQELMYLRTDTDKPNQCAWDDWIVNLSPSGWMQNNIYKHDFPSGVVFRRGFVTKVKIRTEQFLGSLCVICDGLGLLAPMTECHVCGGTGRVGGIAKKLAEAYPLEEVELTDKKPHWNGLGYCWYGQSRLWPSLNVPAEAELPEVIDAKFLTRPFITLQEVGTRYVPFPSEKAARKALSDACVKFARSQVEWLKEDSDAPQESDRQASAVSVQERQD